VATLPFTNMSCSQISSSQDNLLYDVLNVQYYGTTGRLMLCPHQSTGEFDIMICKHLMSSQKLTEYQLSLPLVGVTNY